MIISCALPLNLTSNTPERDSFQHHRNVVGGQILVGPTPPSASTLYCPCHPQTPQDRACAHSQTGTLIPSFVLPKTHTADQA